MESRALGVRWKDMPRWDIKSARAAVFRLAHPHFRPFGEFIEDATETVRPADMPDHEWPVYGVSNVEGVFHSHNQKGADFNSTYKRIRKDWFFHNPTRANVGSFGRVPDVPVDAITSPEYQVWRIKEGLLPEYVEILIKTPFFLKLVQHHRVGAVKERLFFENLAEIPVPVLSISEQRFVIREWQQAQSEAEQLRKEAADLKHSQEVEFLAELGLSIPKVRDMPKILVMSWSNLDRWSVMYNQLGFSEIELDCARYPVMELGTVAAVSYGVQKSPQNRPGMNAYPYLRVANVQRGRLDLDEIKYIDVQTSALEGLRLESGDLLFVEGNGSRSELGRCAIWRGEIEDCVHQNHILKVRCRCDLVLPDFAIEWFNTSAGRQHFFRNVKTSSGLGTINSNELRTAPIPIPSLERQNGLVKNAERSRMLQSSLLQRASARLQRATKEIELQITGHLSTEMKIES